jgi:hypothetical protein
VVVVVLDSELDGPGTTTGGGETTTGGGLCGCTTTEVGG